MLGSVSTMKGDVIFECIAVERCSHGHYCSVPFAGESPLKAAEECSAWSFIALTPPPLYLTPHCFARRTLSPRLHGRLGPERFRSLRLRHAHIAPYTARRHDGPPPRPRPRAPHLAPATFDPSHRASHPLPGLARQRRFLRHPRAAPRAERNRVRVPRPSGLRVERPPASLCGVQ